KLVSNPTASRSKGTRVAIGQGARAAVAIVRDAHATKVANCSHIRVVPRSRMVSRSALYSASSRAVIPSYFASIPDGSETRSSTKHRSPAAEGIVAHELVTVQVEGRDCLMPGGKYLL